jgi:uncharacterized caspase-like protein
MRLHVIAFAAAALLSGCAGTVKQTFDEMPSGHYVAYASQPGGAAFDGEGRNGYFTAALLASLREPDLNIDKVFERVQGYVLKNTKALQKPWSLNTLGQPFDFRSPVATSFGGPKLALVIGNADYKNFTKLRNPVNDAKDMGDLLEQLGFTVTLRQNLDRAQMLEAIQAFNKQIEGGGAGVIFFAGHGLQAKGLDYVVPVNAEVKSENDLAAQGIESSAFLAGEGDQRRRIRIVIFDAARALPYSQSGR